MGQITLSAGEIGRFWRKHGDELPSSRRYAEKELIGIALVPDRDLRQ